MYTNIIRPLLFNLDSERAHDLGISVADIVNQSPFLQFITDQIYGLEDPALSKEILGMTFPNPIGLAAGFDKNGLTPNAMQALGFGFVEIGSITAHSSDGNPRPRAFRLPEDESLINRMGLNNRGTQDIIKRISEINTGIPIGVNIAKTNDPRIHGDSALDDYLYSYQLALPVADYITVNISCPNTGEGKTFEDPAALKALLGKLDPASRAVPTFVKFSVDTSFEILFDLIEICENHGIKGYVATNTSSNRNGLKTGRKTLDQIGNGGLSGAAIEKASTDMISYIRETIPQNRVIIGVGGVRDTESAMRKLDAGADLLQVYTGLVYEGPGLVKKIKKGLIEEKK